MTDMTKSTDEDIAYLSIAGLTTRYRDGSLSPVEATRIALDRIEVWNPHINAFCLVDAERAQTAARAAEQRWRSNAPLGALDGVPISIKDTLQVAGLPLRRGSKVTSTDPVTESAPAVDRLAEAGAVILGTTTTPEYGAGPVTISPLTGITRNPWNPAMTSGGSSGGAAASIAAGIGYAAIGTDAGGSIRIPSSLCGTVGFKPTGGRVPVYPPNVAGSLSTPGPITRHVADAALIETFITDADLRDVEGLAPEQRDYAKDLDTGVAGLRIAYATTLGYTRKIDPDVAARFADAVAVFVAAGAAVEPAHPGIDDPIEIFTKLFHAGFAFAVRGLSNDKRSLLGPILRDAVTAGESLSLSDYLAAQEARKALAQIMARFHRSYDLLLLPTLATTAFPAERVQPVAYENSDNMRAWTPFGYVFNLTAQPAISIPCGFSATGLPIGLQIVGPRFSDASVLRAARLFEKSAPTERRRPVLPLKAAHAAHRPGR
jgi:aspartyl-tRNA(Asn)/glutamyl-tRNA(Gln) amidotransferase subunit A